MKEITLACNVQSNDSKGPTKQSLICKHHKSVLNYNFLKTFLEKCFNMWPKALSE